MDHKFLDPKLREGSYSVDSSVKKAQYCVYYRGYDFAGLLF